MAQNTAGLLVTSWQILSHQWFPPDKCGSQKFLSPTSHCPSFSHPTPSQQNLQGSRGEMAFYPNSSCCSRAPLCAVVSLRRSCCEAIPGTHSRLSCTVEKHCTELLKHAPVTVCVSGHEPSQKHMTEKVLYWLQLFDRKKKVKNRLWMPINTVWELWVIRDIRFPADVFIP